MKEKLSYDEALQRAEAIITQLEQAEAIGLQEYKKLAAEATSLLNTCHAELKSLAGQLS